MRSTTLRSLLAAALLAMPCHAALASEMVVIVSARSPVQALRPDQVADIFLGHAGHFPDGAEAVALDQGIGSPLRNEFYARVTSKSPALVKAYWTKMIFTGRGKPPRELPNSATVRKEVAANPALIGYIERIALDASVRPVLFVR
ncbi:phosphate ABC transporter substrate-binding protein [Massilia soli]|uniref:Phosphate ABC transporter substrate-binding protein n=1 Tax=Massilia soli TaxID=2792854 RepID=A0ABS7SPK7_9BURK|nr:phosphate ABC transporter substrate-binding protein [Massilia soli]MBZ2207060.1 phosphate ABC transporter substrate-binding protein [Massilia soli]